MDRLRAGLWLKPPVFTYTCYFRHAPIAAGLKGVCRQIGNRWWVAKLTCAWKFYCEKTGAQGQSHSLGLGSLDTVARRTVTTGDCQGCNGWPGHFGVPHPALGAPTTLAATVFTTVGSSGELFCLFRRESGFACSRADTAQSKITEGLRPVGYPHLV